MCCCDRLASDEDHIPTGSQLWKEIVQDGAHLALGAVSLYGSTHALPRDKTNPDDFLIIFCQNEHSKRVGI